MNAKAIFDSFSRKEQTRLKAGALAILGFAGLLYYLTDSLAKEMVTLNQAIADIPDVGALQTTTTGKQMSKAEGKELERKRDKFNAIRKAIEGFIPKDGGKPAPITINDIVQKIPDSIDVEKSERSEDASYNFSEMLPGAFPDPRNLKPTFKFQSLQYSFALRTTYTSLVELMRELDIMKAFWFVKTLNIKPPESATGKDPKFLVELNIASIYIHKGQPTWPTIVPRQ